jgi:hypothetical protein
VINELKVNRIGKAQRVASENLEHLLNLNPNFLGPEQGFGVRLEIPTGSLRR